MQGEDPGLERFWKTVAAEIDRPFPAGAHHPIRWRVCDDPANGSHLLVAIYRHLVADAAASCLLVGRVLRKYYRQAGGEAPLVLHSPDYATVMGSHYRRHGYLPSFLQATRRFFRLCRVYRLPEAKDGGEGWGFHALEAPPGLIGRLVAACRERGVTANEAFLAALCAGAGRHDATPPRAPEAARRATTPPIASASAWGHRSPSSRSRTRRTSVRCSAGSSRRCAATRRTCAMRDGIGPFGSG